MSPTPMAIEVWGDFACFSRPETKAERFSYPCPTPSAARGIFDAIYCHRQEFCWQVTRIELLTAPQWIALRRNEVKDRVNVRSVHDWMAGKAPPEPIWADGDADLLGTDQKGRTQRQTMALRNPRFRLTAQIRPWPGHEAKQPAFEEQFRRRVQHGKCFAQPAFGCREFPAYFEEARNGTDSTKPVPHDEDVGFMLYDVFDLSRPGASTDAAFVSLFRAKIRQGVLEIPPFEDDAVVLKPERRNGNAAPAH